LEEYILTVFENRVLRRILIPKVEEVAEGSRKYIIFSFIVFSVYQILLGVSNQGEWDGHVERME
jgi:hypothetical protein